MLLRKDWKTSKRITTDCLSPVTARLLKSSKPSHRGFSSFSLRKEQIASSNEALTPHDDQLQPSYGYDGGMFALGGEQVSLWSDEQLASLSGGENGLEGGGQMELSSRLGYGIRLWDGERLLTPFTELRLGAGGSRSLGLGLSLSTPSWEVELKGASEGGSGRAATGKVDLTFSRKL